jgi:hypothetical protein
MADEAKTKMANDKAALEQQNALRQKQAEERAKYAGKPTPTQMECDLAKLGNAPELEPDGSPPDPNNQPINPYPEKKELHSGGGGGSYQTRQVGSERPGATVHAPERKADK